MYDLDPACLHGGRRRLGFRQALGGGTGDIAHHVAAAVVIVADEDRAGGQARDGLHQFGVGAVGPEPLQQQGAEGIFAHRTGDDGCGAEPSRLLDEDRAAPAGKGPA